ncbi:MAG: LPS export ABC transporter periplasmic protein LptC [Pseudomonadota bacterium]
MDSSPSSETLFNWAPQRQITLKQAKRRTVYTNILRIIFVAGASISAGIFVGPVIASALTSPSTEVERFDGEQVVTMVNARFTGRNVAGETFEITADTARRRRNDPSIIDLENPELVDQLGTVITAPTGTYYQNEEYLDLFEDVRVVDSEGYEFNTTAARAFVRDGRVRGLEPLQGTGPLGDVRADTYEILDEGDRVVLRGNVDMTIYPGGREPSSSPDPME